MAEVNIYVKAEKNIEVKLPEVFVDDIARIYTADTAVAEKIKAIKVYVFEEGEQRRQVVSILKIIQLIEENYPGAAVLSIGAADTLIEWVQVKKNNMAAQIIKVIIAGGVSFFGTAFTIMAFHNDVSINNVFSKFYEMVMGQPSNGYTVLEVAYSVGLALGIIIFYNHIGGRRITKDPTPIEVAIRNYEDDVNEALIATADREGTTIDNS